MQFLALSVCAFITVCLCVNVSRGSFIKWLAVKNSLRWVLSDSVMQWQLSVWCESVCFKEHLDIFEVHRLCGIDWDGMAFLLGTLEDHKLEDRLTDQKIWKEMFCCLIF